MTFVQNSDRNVGPANYGMLTQDQLLVTKIFLTHQGEGPFAGRPAIFLRLAGCNRGAKLTMGCQFCDTAFQFDQGRPLRFHEIRFEIEQLFVEGWKEEPILVITGGEPMIQNNLIYFLEYARHQGAPIIQIESNGDRIIPNFPNDPRIVLVISPKITKEGYRELKPEVRARANAIKFIISADPDSPYHQVPDWQGVGPILLSPMTVYKRALGAGEVASAWDPSLIDHQATSLNYAYAQKLAIKLGVRLSMQTHLFFEAE